MTLFFVKFLFNLGDDDDEEEEDEDSNDEEDGAPPAAATADGNAEGLLKLMFFFLENF